MLLETHRMTPKVGRFEYYTSHILTKSTKLQVSPTWISLNHTQFVSVFLVCAHPSVRPSVRPPARPSTYLSTRLSVCLYVCMSVGLSVS